MIHILQGYSLADRRMATMFADRKRLFVDLMRWSVPVVDAAMKSTSSTAPMRPI